MAKTTPIVGPKFLPLSLMILLASLLSPQGHTKEASRRLHKPVRNQEKHQREKCHQPEITHYDPDASHPLNRVYEALYVRKAADSCYYGSDVLDPLLCDDTKDIFEAAHQEKALAALRDLELWLAAGNPLGREARALIQRDLLQVFHWIASQSAASQAEDFSRLTFALAHSIERFSLSPSEIRSLPANLDAALRAARGRPDSDSLLARPLHSAVLVSEAYGLAAPVHFKEFRAGSAFFLYFLLPGGHVATAEYLRRLSQFSHPILTSRDGTFQYRNPQTPQFPDGTLVALVRRAILWSSEGTPVVSPLTESIQLRFYRSVEAMSMGREVGQIAVLYELSRSAYLQGKAGGLEKQEAASPGHFDLFLNHSHDSLISEPLQFSSATQSCLRCHGQYPSSGHEINTGIHSVHSYTKEFDGKRTARFVLDGEGSEVAKIISSAKSAKSWTLLEQIHRP